jgi:hypothetical protein
MPASDEEPPTEVKLLLSHCQKGVLGTTFLVPHHHHLPQNYRRAAIAVRLPSDSERSEVTEWRLLFLPWWALPVAFDFTVRHSESEFAVGTVRCADAFDGIVRVAHSGRYRTGIVGTVPGSRYRYRHSATNRPTRHAVFTVHKSSQLLFQSRISRSIRNLSLLPYRRSRQLTLSK